MKYAKKIKKAKWRPRVVGLLLIIGAFGIVAIAGILPSSGTKRVRGELLTESGQVKGEMNVLATLIATHVGTSSDTSAKAVIDAIVAIDQAGSECMTSSLTGGSFLVNRTREVWIEQVASETELNRTYLILLRFTDDAGSEWYLVRTKSGRVITLPLSDIDSQQFIDCGSGSWQYVTRG